MLAWSRPKVRRPTDDATSRAILEDRYDGLKHKVHAGEPLESSKLILQLDNVLTGLVAGVARRDPYAGATETPLAFLVGELGEDHRSDHHRACARARARPMTAPTEQEVREAVQAAGDMKGTFNEPGPEFALHGLVETWHHNLMGSFWQRWPCDDENCPARPEWDKRLDELYDSIEPLTAECIALINNRLAELAMKFTAEYPDAPRAREKVPA